MQLTLVLGTARQQVTGGSYRQETLGRVLYQLYVNPHWEQWPNTHRLTDKVVSVHVFHKRRV